VKNNMKNNKHCLCLLQQPFLIALSIFITQTSAGGRCGGAVVAAVAVVVEVGAVLSIPWAPIVDRDQPTLT
jgi:hypothetical protein